MAIYEPTPFTNISKDAWTGKHDGEEYVFQSGETKYFPSFLVNGFVNQFTNWAINTEEFGIKLDSGAFDKPKFLSDKKSDMEIKLRNANYKVVPFDKPQEEIVPVEEEIKIYKCDVCGRSFKNQGGLNLHKTSHKVEKPVQS